MVLQPSSRGSSTIGHWAVTIPLTILVLTLWALGMFLPWKEWFGKETRRLRTQGLGSKDGADEV